MAGEAYPGRNMYLGIGIQSGVGSSATVFTFLQPTEVTGGLEEFDMIESQRRLSTRFKGSGYVGTKRVPVGFTVEANPDNIGRLLKLIFGSETVTAMSPGYYAQHKFYPNEELKYGTILIYAAGIADAAGTYQLIRVKDFKVARATISGGIDNVMTIAVEGVGTARDAVYASSYTVSFSSVDPLFLNSAQGTGKLSIGPGAPASSEFDEARSFSLEVQNGVAPDHRIHASNSAVAIREGDSAITGTIGVVFNKETFTEINHFQAGTARALLLEVTSTDFVETSEHYEMNIAIEQAKYSGGNPSWDADEMTAELPFTAELASSQAISVTIQCSITSEFTYSV